VLTCPRPRASRVAEMRTAGCRKVPGPARTAKRHAARCLFDREQQRQDWNKANEMLAELNEAYSILRDPSRRKEYDRIRSGRPQRHATSPPPRSESNSAIPFELGELTPGYAIFASLPNDIQERLRRRQENKGEEQFQLELSSVVWNYVFVGILLCWFWYLFVNADGAKWKDDTLLWYSGVTLGVGFLIGWNVVTITRWARSTLKPYFYVTPIYFIKTEYDIISFRPIWSLKDVAITHNYRNGSYQNSDVVLKFDGYDESLSLSSKKQVEAMFNTMRTYDTRLRTAYANRDQEYFRKNDDFFKVPRSGAPTVTLLSKEKRATIYVTSLLLCAIGMYAATTVNRDLAQKRWVRHPSPTTNTTNSAPPRIARPSFPEQPLPYNGSVHMYTAAAREAPFEIKAAQGSHYLVKLVDTFTKLPVLTVFVQRGTKVNIDVPFGTYEVRYASGETWYGYEYLFGPDTAYSKADKKFTFEVIENQISGFTITLYKVAHGNLHTSAIKPIDF